MRKDRENVVTEEQETMPAKYREVFNKMDAYRRGEISYQEYFAIPHETLMAARAWRGRQVNQALEDEFPDVDLDSGR